VLGSVVMYMMSIVSLFILRKKEPDLERTFIAPVYPAFPAIALIISLICLFAIIWFNVVVSLIFFAIMAVAIIIFMLMGKHKVKILDDVLMVQAESMIKGKS
ncbi:MAG: eat, partial [Mucilaginibacter sp.]|nr:eat [Mucilaginibacter sp.]